MPHCSFGLGILALTGLRLAWRQGTVIPSMRAALALPQRLAARAITAAFYALLGVQPLLRLAGSLLHGGHVILFYRFVVSAVLPVDWPLAHRIFEAHVWASLLLLALIGVRVAASLHHHLIRRDQALAGVLPWCSPSLAGPGQARMSR
jgi:cytochrome b561